MATGLGLKRGDPVTAILEYCRKTAFAMLRKAKSIATIWELERVLCAELNLAVHEIHSDEDMNLFIREYAGAKGETVVASLPMQLEGDCCGVLIRLRNSAANGEPCYAAFIDCRGTKRARRFFTRWHEIAHRLTFYEQEEMAFRHTTVRTVNRDPIERMMDMIAADLGFFEPLFGPVLRNILGDKELTFDVIEAVRSQFCPDASFEATVNACLARMSRPAIIVEAWLEHKKSEKHLIEAGSSSGIKVRIPKKELRVQRVHANDAARIKKMIIPKNMRVPVNSVIMQCFQSHFPKCATAVENLSDWTSSSGGSLPRRIISVSARSFGDSVVAIIQEAVITSKQ